MILGFHIKIKRCPIYSLQNYNYAFPDVSNSNYVIQKIC